MVKWQRSEEKAMPARLAIAVVLSAALPVAFASDEPRLKIVTSKALPRIESVAVYKSGEAKTAKPVVTITSFKEAAVLPGAGPYDIYAKPKGGRAVLIAKKLTVKPAQVHELRLADRLGTIAVFQKDDSPRAEKIVVTATDDPGPDEKGHVPVQVGSDYRDEMLVPEGFYAVWVVPANGARAQRVADRVRVLPGRNVRVE
jgi:hypothetical protein